MGDLHIVTVATESKYYFPYLVDSCRRYGKELETLGFGQKWKGFNWKFKLMIEYLKTLPESDIVCFVDGYDVICTRNLNELKNLFLKIRHEKKCKIIVGCDNVKHTHYVNKFTIPLYYGTCNNISLNSGTYIGYVKDLLEIIEEIQSENSEDSANDQPLMMKLCKMNSAIFYMDINNDFFLTLVRPLREIDDILEINEYGEISYNGVHPFFLHGPGSTYFDNVLKKIGYDNSIDINRIIKDRNDWVFIFCNEHHNLFVLSILILTFFLFLIIVNLYKYFQKH